MIIRTTSMTVPVTVTVTVLMKMMMTLKDRAVNRHREPRERAPVRSQLLFSCRNDLTELQMYQHIDGTFQTDNPFKKGT